MQRLELKPTHKPVQNYYAALRQFYDLGATHETAVRSAFQGLLDHCAHQQDWTLVPEWEIRRPRQHPLRVDGALLDNFRLTHGFWEAKDSRDDLPKEARKKFDLGYSAFGPCDIDDVCSSDYYRHHRLVADYVDGKSTANPRDVAKAIRPLLEGYYHRRFPGRIPRKLMFGQIIALAANAQAGDPLAYLQPLLKELGEVNDYAGQFQHDTNQGYETVPVVDGELLGFAKRALKLIYENG